MRFVTKHVSIIPECRVDTDLMKIYSPFSQADLAVPFDNAQTCEDFAESGEVVLPEEICN